MKLSDYVIDHLVENNITHVFEVCGGALAHLLNSLYDRTDITTVSMHHEMAAAIAAEGYARASENFGVAMATSGPGATNLITGIGSCYFDSVPCMFITGQVNTYEYKYDNPIRQLGFQETDIVSVVKPLVKKAKMIDKAEEIIDLLDEMDYVMHEGRPGPVLLDIPMNVQRANIEMDGCHPHVISTTQQIPRKQIEKVNEMIREARRPVILAGGGVRSGHACELLQNFSRNTGIPVVTSLMGLDSIPHSESQFVGMIGTYGNRYANLAIANSDLVIALGTRLDTRQTGTNPKTFARDAKIIHVDIDPSVLAFERAENKIIPEIGICADVRTFLLEMKNTKSSTPYKMWMGQIEEYKKKYPNYNTPSSELIHPNYFMNQLSQYSMSGSIFCADVGQIQMWAAQSLLLKKNQRFLTQGGMASIGSALPLAIGASFAKPKAQVIAIVGDGGFQLNIQELQTVFHHQLPIKIIMLNNNGYGMIKQFQEQYMDSRFQSSGRGFSNPDFVSVVSAYRIRSEQITKVEEIGEALGELMSDMSPGFLEVMVDPDARALPKLSVNKPVEDQEPLLSREELKKNMIIKMLPEE